MSKIISMTFRIHLNLHARKRCCTLAAMSHFNYAKDIQDLKKLIEKQISSQYLQVLNSITKKEIFDQIEKNHEIDLPQNLILLHKSQSYN